MKVTCWLSCDCFSPIFRPLFVLNWTTKYPAPKNYIDLCNLQNMFDLPTVQFASLCSPARWKMLKSNSQKKAFGIGLKLPEIEKIKNLMGKHRLVWLRQLSYGKMRRGFSNLAKVFIYNLQTFASVEFSWTHCSLSGVPKFAPVSLDPTTHSRMLISQIQYVLIIPFNLCVTGLCQILCDFAWTTHKAWRWPKQLSIGKAILIK